MRSLDQARESWKTLRSFKSLVELKQAVHLEPRSFAATNRLRSACWKAFLLFDTLETDTWQKTLQSSRSAYDSLRAHFLRLIDNPDEVNHGFDPLTQEAEDEELRAEILQDIDRCMPDVEYFRRAETQRVMLDVLFIFCKLNPDIGYRQGMHELLAHVLWVVEADALELGQSSKALGEDAIIRYVFDADHIEHDAFALFGQVMQSSKGFYISEGPISIAARSQHIFAELLPQVDPLLAKHLSDLDVVPQVYLIRWIRLLFGREFDLNGTLALWDVMFAEDQSLEIVDLIAVAMLLRIRWNLLDGDYNTVLSILLKYPSQGPEHQPQSFALDALHLKNHMSIDGASFLVSKYTGQPITRPNRPGTPPALQRNITAFSGLSAPRSPRLGLSPPRTPRQNRNIEAILQNTAKNIFAQGEKLGINKAVRNAVDEVHRKAQEIRDSQAPSPPPWRRAESTRLADRVRELEARNKRLSVLLAGAVGELWDQQKAINDSAVAEKSVVSSDSMEKLSAAIAKVQFVQVYLDEPTLVLPDMDNGSAEGEQTSDQGGLEQADDGNEKIDDPLQDKAMPAVHPKDKTKAERGDPFGAGVENLDDPSMFEAFLATPLETPTEPSSVSSGRQAPRVRPQLEDSKLQIDVAKTAPPHAEAKRPGLEQSPYSFILGQESKKPTEQSQNQARNKLALFGDASQSTNRGFFDNEQRSATEQDFDIGSLRRSKGSRQ